jgi:hypothetical protein
MVRRVPTVGEIRPKFVISAFSDKFLVTYSVTGISGDVNGCKKFK